MNGWKRLWILLTVIWALIVVSIATFIVIEDTYDNINGPWIKYRLSDQSKTFYEGLEEDENGPAYTVSFTYEDGTEQAIRFPLIEKEISEINFGEKLAKIAKESGRIVSSKEIDLFKEKVTLKNSQAAKAKEEFDSEIEKAKLENLRQRREIIYSSLAALFIPPIIFLFLGYGIAWVRRGFKSNA